jgi:hypothetical protein
MRIFKSILPALLFVAAAGCGGSTPPVKSGDDGAGAASSGSTDGKQAECDAIGVKFKEIDDTVKGAKGMAAGRALGPALQKLSKELKESPMKTPGLDKTTAELATEADSFAGKLKEMIGVFEEMEKIGVGLQDWQKKVEQVAEAFDVACSKAPKAECESLSKQVTKIPQLEGDDFASYSKELESFIATTSKVPVKDAQLKKSLDAMLSVLGESVKPMRRLAELAQEPAKLDPEADKLKAKFNAVREMCGMPLRK